jgi:hypothetical protein
MELRDPEEPHLLEEVEDLLVTIQIHIKQLLVDLPVLLDKRE